MEVSRCSTKKQIRDLAFILNVSCPSPVADEVDPSQVLQLLKEWLENSETNAFVAVLTDALHECDLGEVIRNCFGYLGKDTLVCKFKQRGRIMFYLLFRCHFFI